MASPSSPSPRSSDGHNPAQLSTSPAPPAQSLPASPCANLPELGLETLPWLPPPGPGEKPEASHGPPLRLQAPPMATLRTAHRPGAAFFLPSCPELSLQPPSPPPAPQPASSSDPLGLRGQPPSGTGSPITASWDFFLLSQALPPGIHCLPHQTKPPMPCPGAESLLPASRHLAQGKCSRTFCGRKNGRGRMCVPVSLPLSPVTPLGSPFRPSFKASCEAKRFSQFLWAPAGEAGRHPPTTTPPSALRCSRPHRVKTHLNHKPKVPRPSREQREAEGKGSSPGARGKSSSADWQLRRAGGWR